MPGSVPCVPGCTCWKHTHPGHKCPTGCTCGHHRKLENRRNQFSDRPADICHLCGETDPLKFKQYKTNGSRRTKCKQCIHDREFMNKWGLTYQEMIDRFGDNCGICLQPEKVIDTRTGVVHRLSVDHDHKHCKLGCAECMRGLLCRRCNYKLGQFEDEIIWIDWAKEYLARVSTND